MKKCRIKRGRQVSPSCLQMHHPQMIVSSLPSEHRNLLWPIAVHCGGDLSQLSKKKKKERERKRKRKKGKKDEVKRKNLPKFIQRKSKEYNWIEFFLKETVKKLKTGQNGNR